MNKNFLKPCNQKITTYDLYGFDIETYGKYNRFIMGSIVNDKEKFVFWDKREMQDFILNSYKLKNSRLYATNLGFDFLGLFGDNFDLLSKFNYIIRGSEFINIKYTNEINQNINFGDTYNFLRLGVDNLGKIIGERKLKIPSFLGKKPKSYTQEKQLENYNIQDSYVTFKFMDFLQKGFNDLGTSLKYTVASTSMNLFRNKYLHNWLEQPERDIIKLSYKAYYGGRTEAFYRGEISKSYLYDINSLYPYVMKKYHYPNPNTMLRIKGNKSNIKYIMKNEGISFVYVYCPFMYYPLLPYRRDDKLIFPTGFFSGWYSHAELRKALELGYKILDIYDTIYYRSNIKIFQNFITDLYNKRMEYKKQNNNLQIVYKIALNSLYGKFAQKLEQSEIYFVNNQEDKNKVNSFISENIFRQKNGMKIRFLIDTPDKRVIKENGVYYDEPRLYYVTDLEKEKIPKFINPIISLYITSYARLELYSWFEKILNKNGKIYYCDTDSVITDIKLQDSKDLGGMKLEYNINNGILVKPKFYYLKGTYPNGEPCEICKIKGLMRVKGYESFKDILESYKYRFEKFTKFKESLRRNLEFNQKIEVMKTLNLNDNKREWFSKNFNHNMLEISKPIELKIKI